VLLVLRALGLGDFLTAVPALRALRRAFPEQELVLAAPPVLGPLAALSAAVDRIHPTNGLDDFTAPAEPVDLAVNLHGRGPESHQALLSGAPAQLLAFGCPQIGYAGPDWRDDEHEVERWCRLLHEGCSIAADRRDLLLDGPSEASLAPGAVVIHPGAAYPARRWPVDRFAEVARWAEGHGHQVVVTGSVAELPQAEAVRARAHLNYDAVLAGRTDLAELAALVAQARLVISGDTGIAHLASAYWTPSVVLFGPVAPALWGPPPSGPHVALWHGEEAEAGDPWGDEPDPSLLLIEADEVIEHATVLLDATTSVAERSA